MKKCDSCCSVITSLRCMAQPAQDAATLQETARSFMRQGDYENTVLS